MANGPNDLGSLSFDRQPHSLPQEERLRSFAFDVSPFVSEVIGTDEEDDRAEAGTQLGRPSFYARITGKNSTAPLYSFLEVAQSLDGTAWEDVESGVTGTEAALEVNGNNNVS